MTSGIFLVLLLAFLGLTYLALVQIIKWYYKSRIARYAIQSNYLSRVAILIVYAAFCSINPSISGNILNWLIEILNDNLNTTLLPLESVVDIPTLFAFGIFCLFIGYTLHKSYESRLNIYKNSQQIENTNSETKLISFPNNDWSEPAIFHLRIKSLFELLYKREMLKLKVASKADILFGSFEDGIRQRFLIIKYDAKKRNDVSKEGIENILKELKKFIDGNQTFDVRSNTIIDYYYCPMIELGEKYNTELNIQTEENLISRLINFIPYLEGTIANFQNEKLYSATTKSVKVKTLKDTFLLPNFKLQSGITTTLNLDKYIDDWLLNCSDAKHLVLLGDYGMGKTSFLKYYASKLAESVLKGENTRIPVYISLTNCSPRHGGIDQKVKAFVADNLGVDYENFEYLIHKGRILFLLDGFDEMGFIDTHSDRFKQMNEIWQLALKNNKIILSGRPSYFPTEFELKQALNIVEINSQIIQTDPYCESITLETLEEEQIKLYIKKFYPDRHITFFDWLKQSSSLIELCKRPSILHIISEMLPNIVSKDRDLIYTQGGAIEKYIEYWINRQETKRIQSAFPNSEKKVKFIKDFFQKVAVDLFMSDKYELTADDLKLKLSEYINQNIEVQFQTKTQQEGFENEILTGYFMEMKDSYYLFVHKSFFEFFVAQQIISAIKQRHYKDLILYKEWSNSVVNFVYDSIDIKHRQDIKVPALLLLRNGRSWAKTKFNIYKFFIQEGEGIQGVLIMLFLVTGSIIFFKYLDFAWYWMTLLYILFLVITMVIGVTVVIAVDNFLYRHRKIKFIEKACKIAFLKGQFRISENLQFVLNLMSVERPPLIPIESETFSDYTFKKYSFSFLKNVLFSECDFAEKQIKNCKFQNVTFKSCAFNQMVFLNCQFVNTIFEDCRFVDDPKNIKIERFPENKICFLDCTFDKNTINSIKLLQADQNLELGKDLNGSKNFIDYIGQRK